MILTATDATVAQLRGRRRVACRDVVGCESGVRVCGRGERESRGVDLCADSVRASARVLRSSLSQLVHNYRTGSVRGLSGVFLVQWTLGDLTNLVGAILTKQLVFQVIIAVYMLLIDSALVAQYFCASASLAWGLTHVQTTTRRKILTSKCVQTNIPLCCKTAG